MGLKNYIKNIFVLIKRAALGMFYLIFRTLNKPFKILTSEETIKLIINKKVSIGRFGDDEFNIMQGKTPNSNYQIAYKDFTERLNDVKGSDNFIVCLPISISLKNSDLRKIYKKNVVKGFTLLKFYFYAFTYKHFKKEKVIGNASFTRFYYDFLNPNENIIPMVRTIWDKQEVIIIEGKDSRFGYGNGLLDNTSSVKRILGPASNSFSKIEEIEEYVRHNVDKKSLLLIAMGATATIISYDLSKEGFWCIDIGHLDIEYEWYLNKAEEKTAIKHKFTNEAKNGNKPEPVYDRKYLSQIIASIY